MDMTEEYNLACISASLFCSSLSLFPLLLLAEVFSHLLLPTALAHLALRLFHELEKRVDKHAFLEFAEMSFEFISSAAFLFMRLVAQILYSAIN